MIGPTSDDHDPGDEDRRGSVVCWCAPWCGLPVCWGCGEDHGGNNGLCRDCDLDYCFARMTCTVCGKMRTATTTPLGDIATALWGPDHRCTCPEPRPETLGRAWAAERRC